MATIPLPECDTEALKARLWDEYRVEIPVMRWKRPAIRISVQGYNTLEDVDRLVEALAALLPQVRR
jgi:isopenicillin-N epimerase